MQSRVLKHSESVEARVAIFLVVLASAACDAKLDGDRKLGVVAAQATALDKNSLTSYTDQDDTKLSNSAISINANAYGTNNTTVTLTLVANDASEMEVYITNAADCLSGGIWEPFVTSKTWTIEPTEGLATVYTKFRDTAGNESDCVSDLIHYGKIIYLSQSAGYLSDVTETLTFAQRTSDPSDGGVFTIDAAKDRLVKVNADGSILWSYGATGDGEGEFSALVGVAFNASTRRLYVADQDNSRVQIFYVP